MLDAIARMAFTEDARTGSVLLWSDTLASLTRMALGIAVAALAGLPGHRLRRLSDAAGDPVAPDGGPLDDPAAGDPAHPVHRLRTRRTLQGHAHRHRHHAGAGARPGAAGPRDSGRTAGQGADPGRQQLDGGAARDTAAIAGAAAAIAAADARGGLAIPDLVRGDFGDGRPGLSDLPGATLHVDGCHPALCGLDHAPGLGDGLGVAPDPPQVLPWSEGSAP